MLRVYGSFIWTKINMDSILKRQVYKSAPVSSLNMLKSSSLWKIYLHVNKQKSLGSIDKSLWPCMLQR